MLRGELGDENGETDLEQMSMCLEKEENPKRAIHTDGRRHTT